MADATPTTFELAAGDGSVGFDEVRLHRTIETDEAGHSRIHVWVTGRAVVRDGGPFHSISANVAFSLFDGSRLLGVCTTQGLVFENSEQSLPVTADEDLYLELQDSVTEVEAQVETSKTIRNSVKLRFEKR